jgi:amino acid transporter
MKTTETSCGSNDVSSDVALLKSLGYSQELLRRMSGFSNFAISFSIICILAGGVTSLQLGVCAVGGAAAGIVWPVGVVFGLLVALAMAQIASAYPTAGGLYHWSSILGGKGWGWATAWFNLLGLIFVTAAVNVGAYALFTSIVLPLFGVDPSKLTLVHQFIGVVLITGSQALFNHWGIKVTTLLTDLSGYLIFVVAALLTVAMFAFAHTHDFGRLFQFTNTSGDPGGGTWPASGNMAFMLLLAMLWPIYTITGFDASAHTSEETVDAAKNVPKGILRSVYLSGIFGWIMVISFVIAMPSIADGAKQGSNVFFWLMDQVIPMWLKIPLEIGIVVSNYLCGLACVTSTSRMMYAFARDGGLPKILRKVSAKHTVPAPAIWCTAFMVVACTVYAQAYTTLTAACVIFLYMSYVMPPLVGIFAYGKSWTKMGPFNLGPAVFKTVSWIGVAGVLLIIYAGIQPPNNPALPALIGMVVLLVVGWFAGIRKVFAGPPMLAAQTDREPPSPPPDLEIEPA